MANPIATITNNSDFDVDVYDVFDHSRGGGGPITYTKLGTVLKGKTEKIQTVHYASQLQAMRTGDIETLKKYYHQFPVAVMPIMPLGTHKTLSYIITNDDRNGMEQAFLFQKYVSANPASQLAMGFKEALSSEDQENAINDFFNSTVNFKQASLKSWSAIMNWQSQFLSAWQGSYYLYTVPSEKSSATPKLIATILIQSDAENNNATLKLAGQSSESVNLAISETVQEESPGKDPIAVSLTPVWLNSTILQEKDGKKIARTLIGGAFSGTVNGNKVYGTGESRQLPEGANSGKSAAQKRQEEMDQEREFDRKFGKITGLISLLVGGITAYLFYKQTANGHEQRRNDSVESGASDAEVDQALANEDNIDRENLRDAPNNSKVSDGRNSDAEVPGAYREVASESAKARIDNGLLHQEDRIGEILDINPPSEDMEVVLEDLASARAALEESAVAIKDLTAQLKEIRAEISDIREKANNTFTQEENQLTENIDGAMEEGSRQGEAINDALSINEDTAASDTSKVDFAKDGMGELTESPFEGGATAELPPGAVELPVISAP